MPHAFPRYILVSNHLPVKASRENEDADWNFELDIDALVVQAKARHPALCPVLCCMLRNLRFGRLRRCIVSCFSCGHQHATLSLLLTLRS